MHEMLQKMWEESATVKDVHLASVYIEKQWHIPNTDVCELQHHTKRVQKKHKEKTNGITYLVCKEMVPANIANKAGFQKNYTDKYVCN